MFTLENVSDLLPLTATAAKPIGLDTLIPSEQKEYKKAADALIDKWRAENPDGKTLRLKIVRCNTKPNAKGRVAIIVAPNTDLNTESLTYGVEAADYLAENVEIPNFTFFGSLVARTSHDPSFITVKVNAVKAGETYTRRKTGEQDVYKAHGVVVEEGQLELSKSIQQHLNSLLADVEKQEMLDARSRKAAVKVAAPVTAVPADDDLLGG